ncbi:MAG: alanine--tRNA ligase [Acidobacteriota bacterium]
MNETMRSDEVRERFLRYFEERGHVVVRSAPLVPADDPTLLFTNAGMNQFKNVFLGYEEKKFRRATSSQKCLRVSGKHNDFEQVGKTARHHTFFEMLGNFSFGDYFKKEAIAYGWELITKSYRIPEENLWVTVFEEDDEAFQIWEREIGVDQSRIVKMGAKDNFWIMGETGPCGPCSEIHFDQGEGIGCGKEECGVGCDCDRFMELWNLVFIQFNSDEQGKLEPLQAPSIDTGAGLERLAAVLQGVHSNYDTDLFRPLIEETARITAIPYGAEHDVSFRVIADHARAISFLIADGVYPSNTKRGYVLRRILRRAIRHGGFLGLNRPFLHHLTPIVVREMGNNYPELIEAKDYILELCRAEEERYAKTLSTAVALLDELISRSDNEERIISGRDVFKLYDTYGLPLDLAKDIASEKGYSIDEASFKEEMEKQRVASSSKAAAQVGKRGKAVYDSVKEYCSTRFLGYEQHEVFDCRVLEIIRGDETVEKLSVGEKGELILDKTPFYAEAGGQVGDRGYIVTPRWRCHVFDVQTPLPGLIVHHLKVEEGEVHMGDLAVAEIDSERRHRIMRNHTATHLLHYALRDSVGLHIKQCGSLVEPDRLRFDFSHYSALSSETIAEIERTVNRIILEDIPIDVEESSYREALEKGVIAFFGEKYGERVRVVRIGEVSAELCGGIHCRRTGEIGLFKIVLERSVASGIRRIEAVTGDRAFHLLRENYNHLEKIKDMLNISHGDPVEAISQWLSEIRSLKSEISRLRMKGLTGEIRDECFERIETIKGHRVVIRRVDGLEKCEMRTLADNLKKKLGSAIIILENVEEEKVALLVAVTENLAQKCNAAVIAREMAAVIGGRGGGRADLAEAGGRDLKKLDEAIERGMKVIEEIC